MTELELYKFITKSSVEWNWRENNGKPDVLMWINQCDTWKFQDLFDKGTPDGGFPCRMTSTHFTFWMQDICDYHGIDSRKIFEGGANGCTNRIHYSSRARSA